MENNNVSLPNQQALLSAPKNEENSIYVNRPASIMKEKDNAEQIKKSAQWFQEISLGSILYALIYAVCMYRNTAGITFPFCVGATLYFFWYYAKKFCGTVKKCDRFLMIAVILLGVITCTTDSDVLIFFNKLGILAAVCIFLLELFFDVTGWSFAAFTKAGCYTLFGGIGHCVMPYIDGSAYWKVRKKTGNKVPMEDAKKQKMIAIAVGMVISLPMLFVIISLLSSADVFFRELFMKIWDAVFAWETPELLRRNFFGFVGTILVMFSFIYGVVTYISNENSIASVTDKNEKRWNSYIAITFSSLIGMVYMLFAGIQVLGLFMGKLRLPEGYTYAGYAREGFFQLAFICFFNICLVLVCLACFEESKVLRGIMLLLCGCTYIMLASSAYRMILYIRVYQLTFLRVFVLWALVVMAFMMAGIVILIVHKKFPIFRYLLMSILSLYIAFAAAHPDYWIASYNIAKAEAGADVDEHYLMYKLSLDAAAPILSYYEYEINNPEKYYDEFWGDFRLTDDSSRLQIYAEKLEEEIEEMNVRTFNVSRAIAGYVYNNQIQK